MVCLLEKNKEFKDIILYLSFVIELNVPAGLEFVRVCYLGLRASKIHL